MNPILGPLDLKKGPGFKLQTQWSVDENHVSPLPMSLTLGMSTVCQVRCVIVYLSKSKEKGGLWESLGIEKECESHRWEHDKERSLVLGEEEMDQHFVLHKRRRNEEKA